VTATRRRGPARTARTGPRMRLPGTAWHAPRPPHGTSPRPCSAFRGAPCAPPGIRGSNADLAALARALATATDLAAT